MTTPLSFFNLLRLYHLNPDLFLLARHANAEIPILETYYQRPERFEHYQSFQPKGKFRDAKYLAVFAPYKRTTAMFLGVWSVNGYLPNEAFDDEIRILLKEHELPEQWFFDAVKYQLTKTPLMEELAERLVIEWGGGTLSWLQKKDKMIVEIKPQHGVGEFQSYGDLELTFEQLVKIISYPDNNSSWTQALSAVSGVYLIRDRRSGKLYIGSAYGENGIYGRWVQYCRNGHGGNRELKTLDPVNFVFSILEIVAATASADYVIARENHWKERLGTREFGLNAN